jgi:S1-C subfamily serine protease
MQQAHRELQAFSDALADSAERAALSTVAVHARPRLASTGVIWKPGIVVTTEATVRMKDGIAVTLPDGRRVDAKLLGRDVTTDIAALEIPSTEFPAASPADAAAVRVGLAVLALARTSADGVRASFGILSSVGGPWRTWKGGRLDQRIQSEVSLYPGFGGGPLVAPGGGVIGINSGGLSRGLSTTLPRSTVDRVVATLVERGHVARGYLGVALRPVDLPPAVRESGKYGSTGLIVLGLEPAGPAASGGMLLGDILVGIEGRPIDDHESVLRWLESERVGTTLRLDVIRAGAVITLDIRVGERPASK